MKLKTLDEKKKPQNLREYIPDSENERRREKGQIIFNRKTRRVKRGRK